MSYNSRQKTKEPITLDTSVPNRKIRIVSISEHIAVVRALKGRRVELTVPRETLPVSFRSRSILSTTSVSQVIVEVDSQGRDMKSGDHVSVLLEEKSQLQRAIFWTTVFPILVFGVIYTGFVPLIKDERVALIGVAVLLLPYYSFLWLLREYWSKVFIFRLK